MSSATDPSFVLVRDLYRKFAQTWQQAMIDLQAERQMKFAHIACSDGRIRLENAYGRVSGSDEKFRVPGGKVSLNDESFERDLRFWIESIEAIESPGMILVTGHYSNLNSGDCCHAWHCKTEEVMLHCIDLATELNQVINGGDYSIYAVPVLQDTDTGHVTVLTPDVHQITHDHPLFRQILLDRLELPPEHCDALTKLLVANAAMVSDTARLKLQEREEYILGYGRAFEPFGHGPIIRVGPWGDRKENILYAARELLWNLDEKRAHKDDVMLLVLEHTYCTSSRSKRFAKLRAIRQMNFAVGVIGGCYETGRLLKEVSVIAGVVNKNTYELEIVEHKECAWDIYK